MSFSVTGAHVGCLNLIIPLLGCGFMAGLRILLATGLVLSCRGWVAGYLQGFLRYLTSTHDECY